MRKIPENVLLCFAFCFDLLKLLVKISNAVHNLYDYLFFLFLIKLYPSKHVLHSLFYIVHIKLFISIVEITENVKNIFIINIQIFSILLVLTLFV